MASNWNWEQVVYAGACLGTAFMLFRLWWAGILQVYPWLSWFMAFDLARTVLTFRLNPNTNYYAHLWFAGEALCWVFYYLLILELYSAVLESYPGIRRLTRVVLSVGMVVCVGAALVSLTVEALSPAGRYPILHAFNMVRRGIASSLALFLLVMLTYLAWYPVALKRNVRVHAALNVCYFIVISLVAFSRNMIGLEWTRKLSVAYGVATMLIVVVWAILLNRNGESVASSAPLWSHADESRLLGHLESINRTLTLPKT